MPVVPSRLTQDERIRREVRDLFDEAKTLSRYLDGLQDDEDEDLPETSEPA